MVQCVPGSIPGKVRGFCRAQIGAFWPLRFNGNKNWYTYRSHFCKMLISSMNFCYGLPVKLSVNLIKDIFTLIYD